MFMHFFMEFVNKATGLSLHIKFVAALFKGLALITIREM